MHKLFAGLTGIFMGIGALFHGGQGMPTHVNQSPASSQATISGSLRPSGMPYGRGKGMQLPNGERPFFGTVTAVNGSTLTVQMMMSMRHFRNPSITPTITITPGATQTTTILLTGSTKYTRGTQSNITVNTKVAGVGTVNSDSSITALQVTINPTMPGSRGFRIQNGQSNPNPSNINQ